MNERNLALVFKLVGEGNPYTYFTELPDGELACLHRYMYTEAILYGLNETGYEDRWCYTPGTAQAALQHWIDNYDTLLEPTGWHRNPRTGRRRDKDGNTTINY